MTETPDQRTSYESDEELAEDLEAQELLAGMLANEPESVFREMMSARGIRYRSE